jgi:uncharacterized protein YyaL (SSP411 family)
MPNRLANETSPYLLQHSDNPVDWYPWGEEARRAARASDKPIFLSIGYSACHWCHVMAHESFEDERVAAILNQHFVSIKVDREERPDLDRVYMSAVQALTGHGGWPMSVFLTPEGEPFYGGTYYPPTRRYGMPSFTDVLLSVADAWRDRHQELVEGGRRVVRAIEAQGAAQSNVRHEDLRPETLQVAFDRLVQQFDSAHGGWGNGPKFPHPMALEFLLRRHHVTGDAQALQMVSQTLEAMARGGVYDQLGGGFHRYSVDRQWLVPHFEKMLYDNAQLARVYLHAWQVTGHRFLRTICEETLDYVIREMTDPSGGFLSTQDADSEGEEGRFFVWTPGEIQRILEEDAEAFTAAYAVTDRGNFEGKNVLKFVGDLARRPALAAARRRIYEARERRVHPSRDDKILTSWNGLMLAAFAEAARVLGREDYRDVAVRNAEFLLRDLRREDGRVLHSWKDGRAGPDGYLEDYTHLMEGLLELYHTTFDSRWYLSARELAKTMIDHFGALEDAPGDAGGLAGFYDTSHDHERLVVRPRELQDNATPSGNGMAAWVLPRLAALAVEPRFAELAQHSLESVQPLLAEHPLGFGQWLIALDYALSRGREVAVVGDPGAQDTRALLKVCELGYYPHQVVALGTPDEPTAVPLLRDRRLLDGRAAAYVCANLTCRVPVTSPEALRILLESLSAGRW